MLAALLIDIIFIVLGRRVYKECNSKTSSIQTKSCSGRENCFKECIKFFLWATQLASTKFSNLLNDYLGPNPKKLKLINQTNTISCPSTSKI